MREIGIDNYSVDDMDVTFISEIIHGCRNIAPIAERTRRIGILKVIRVKMRRMKNYIYKDFLHCAPIFYKRNLDSNIGNSIIILTEPTTPLIFYAQPSGTFSFMGYFMYQYPKQTLTIEQQVQSIFDKILSLSKEILISEQARDRLLSKLMSGELEVFE